MAADSQNDETGKAKKAAFRLLKVRIRSEQEIRRRLLQKKFNGVIIDRTISYLQNNALIDDTAFTKEWVQSRLRQSFGLDRIRQELLEKGIKNEIIDRELDKAAECCPQEDTVRDLARKQWQKYKGLDIDTGKRRLFSYLTRRGYDPEAVERIIEQL